MSDDGAHVVEGLDGTLGAHQQGLLAFAEAAGAVVAVVGLGGGLQRAEGEAAGGQGSRVGAISKLRASPPRLFTSATPGTVRSCGRIVQSSRVRFSCSGIGPRW